MPVPSAHNKGQAVAVVNSDLPGGKYRWSVNKQGRYTIYDLPIFGEVPAGEKGNAKPLGIAYMFQAVMKARQRKSEGYMSAVHVEHHNPMNSTSPTYAGLLDITRVGKVVYQGSPMFSVFADIVNMPETVAKRIQAGEIPYRSVELPPRDDMPPEICSLALMATTTPFFRLPMTTLGEQVSADRTFESNAKCSPCVGTHGKFVLFDFKGGKFMADDKKPDETKDEKKPDDAQMAEAPVAEPEAPEAPEADVAGICQKVADTQLKILDAIQKISEGLGIGSAPAAPAPTTETPPAMAAFDLAPVMKTIGELTGTVGKLEAKDAAQTKKNEMDAIYAAQVKRLDGYEITDAMKTRIKDSCQFGEKAVAMLVDGIRETAQKDGAKTFDALPAINPKDAAGVDVLSKYAADPARYERAREFLGFWQEAKRINTLDASDRESPEKYIERQFRYDAMGLKV